MSHNRINVLLLVLLSLQLLSTTFAIGGWDPIHILMNRMSEGRSAQQQQQVATTDESTRVSSKLQSRKKNDVVNASSKQQRRKGKEAFVPQNQRRRGFVPRGDVEDANSIEFVRRSNPFL